MSARSFARYFASKDAVLVAVLDDLAEEVAAELRALPADLDPLAAMRSALGAASACAHRERFHSLSGDRVVRIVQVVTASGALQQAAVEYRCPQVVAAMALRMRVGIEDRQLALAMALISVIVLHAWSVVAVSEVRLDGAVIGMEVDRTFVEFAAVAADLAVER